MSGDGIDKTGGGSGRAGDAPGPQRRTAEPDGHPTGQAPATTATDGAAEGRDPAAARVATVARGLVARRQFTPAQQRGILVVSAAAFVVATVVAARNLPPIDGEIRWFAFALVGLLGVPATLWNNGAEFGVIARLTGYRVAPLQRLRIAAIGTAANLLPIPGSILVRGETLRRRGAPLRSVGWATAMTALLWMGCTALVAGGLVAALSSNRAVGLATAAVGAVLCGGAGASVLRRDGLDRRPLVLAHIVAVELASIGIGGLRLWGVLYGIGYDAGIDEAVALTVAGVITSAVGFAPGGLGVRELAAAAISPVVGLSPAVGLLAASVNRLIELAVLSPVSIALMTHRGGLAIESASPLADADDRPAVAAVAEGRSAPGEATR